MIKYLSQNSSLGIAFAAVGVAITALSIGFSSSAQAGASLASHEATYRLSLASVDSGAGLQAVRGVMRYRFADACDGWTSENAVAVEYVYDSGASLRSTWEFTSWEAKSGEELRFAVVEKANGQTTDQFSGRAKVDTSGVSGGTAWRKDEGGEEAAMYLPPGTILPTAHVIALFEAAEQGKPIISKTVFDGTSKDNPYAINAVIGKGRTADSAFATVTAGEDLMTYPMSLAFFQIRARQEFPDYEMSIDYRRDGIAEKVVQTFSDFSLALTPDTLTFLDDSGC